MSHTGVERKNRTKAPTLPWTEHALRSLEESQALRPRPRLSARMSWRRGVTQHEHMSLSRLSSYLGLQPGLLALPLLPQMLDFGCLLLQQGAQGRLQITSFLEGNFDPLKTQRPKSQKIPG